VSEKKYKAPAVEKLLDILELMVGENKDFSVTELSNRLQISANSVFRIMKELEFRHYIQKNPVDSTYRLTGKLYYIGSSLGGRISLKKIAEPSMGKIHQSTRETTLLTIFGKDDSTLVIDQMESPEPIKFISTVGFEYPSHSSAMGKAMLAFLPPEELERYLAAAPLHSATEKTITSPEAFRRELAEIRRTRLATDSEESYIGLRCIAAPVFNAKGTVEGAIGISGPLFRVTDRVMRQFSEIISREASHISEKLGYQDDLSR
jgi:DNA-binding IclR family transcriptional regulator